MNKKFALSMTWIIILTGMVPAAIMAEISVGVKEGDWIEYKITYAAAIPPPEKYATWVTMKILGVQETSVIFNLTVKYSDGTQNITKYIVDIAVDIANFDFFIIPANLENGDIFFSGMGYVTISAVEERTYAGGRRTAVYAAIANNNATTMFYWDKTTGVVLEVIQPKANYTIMAEADKTNMWQAQPSRLPSDSTYLYIPIIVAIAIVATVAFLVIRRRRKRRIRRKRRKLQKNMSIKQDKAYTKYFSIFLFYLF